MRFVAFMAQCGVILGFIACAKYPQIALPYFSQEIFSVKSGANAYLLYISHENSAYHFALFDALGAPVAQKILQDSRFKNTKFLPPNAQFEGVFFKALEMLQNSENYAQHENFAIQRLDSQ